MPSLRELQRQFADALLAADGSAPARAGSAGGAERMAVHRRSVFANYRTALAATYPVVHRLVGTPFFEAAVDGFVHAHPSRSGDLNLYGAAFGEFLAGYAPAADLPYLADVARLEWTIDEVNRAADSTPAPDIVLGALAIVPAERAPALGLRVAPSCRLIRSEFPILRIWKVNQPEYSGDDRVALDEGADRLVVRRDARGIVLERISSGLFAWLEALSAGAPLAPAIESACGADAAFDLGAALQRCIGDGTITNVVDNG
jgi:hypothetical protein